MLWKDIGGVNYGRGLTDNLKDCKSFKALWKRDCKDTREEAATISKLSDLYIAMMGRC